MRVRHLAPLARAVLGWLARPWLTVGRHLAALRRAPRPLPSPGQIELIEEALEAALVDRRLRIAVVGEGGDMLAGRLADAQRGWPARGAPVDVLVLVRTLERATRAELDALLRRAASSSYLAVALVPIWPEARSAAAVDPGLRTLTSREKWREGFQGAGLEVVAELRRSSEGHACFVVRSAALVPVIPDGPGTPPSDTLHLRIRDDLSLPSSFAWITTSIALALEELGASVSLAPTRISKSIPPDRRRRLERLMERDRGQAAPACELGWTHYEWRYRRRLRGERQLALYAVNYFFDDQEDRGLDAWTSRLVAGQTRLAPISTFCRDVLVRAGVPPERAVVVPMGHTEGLEHPRRSELPGARGLSVLHVTNAADPARNGTDIALDAFVKAFGSDEDVTLVVRDYGGYSVQVQARVAGLAGAGYDVRYLPAFFSNDGLAAFLSAFDLLLAPFRGEGFGIKVLDAMACGVPPICPFFGGPLDFIDEAVAFEAPYDLIPVTSGFDAARLGLTGRALWAECRTDELAGALRDAAVAEATRAAKGAAGRQRARASFTWQDTARRVLELAAADSG